jgi:hypothetical protein
MANVSKPMIALLVGTVAFFALWLVALKPSSSSSGGGSGVGAYQPAINAARKAVASSDKAAAAVSGESATASTASTPATASAPATTTPSVAAATTPADSATAAKHATVARSTATTHTPATAARPAPTTTRERVAVLQRALEQHKVLALLFYNPAAADDIALKHELAAVPLHGGKVVKLPVPIPELSRYTVVTDQVPVEVSPTLVLIDRHAQATTIVGFADRFEISGRVDDALASR